MSIQSSSWLWSRCRLSVWLKSESKPGREASKSCCMGALARKKSRLKILHDSGPMCDSRELAVFPRGGPPWFEWRTSTVRKFSRAAPPNSASRVPTKEKFTHNSPSSPRAALFDISQLLQTGLDRQTLEILVDLTESGVNPEASDVLFHKNPHITPCPNACLLLSQLLAGACCSRQGTSQRIGRAQECRGSAAG